MTTQQSATVFYDKGARLGDQLGRGTLLVAGVLGLIEIPNLVLGLTDITFGQIALVLAFTGGMLILGTRFHLQGADMWVVMGTYGWGLSNFFDWVIHLILLIDINNVGFPRGFAWILGPMNYGFMQTEPFWYFIVDTGLVGGIFIAIGVLVNFPRYKPFNFVVWPLIGGFVKSFGYADITKLASHLTGGLVSIRGNWAWTSLWADVYSATLAPSPVGMPYFSVRADWAAVFIAFTNLHWAAIWTAAVVAHYLHTRGTTNQSHLHQ